LPVGSVGVHFIASDQTVPGYRLKLSCADADPPAPPCLGPDNAAGAYAIWPPAAAPVTIVARPTTPAVPAPPVPVEVARALGRELRDCHTGEVPTLEAHQRLKLDLDGDGAAEELLTVRVTPLQANDWEEAQARPDGAAPDCLPSDVDRPRSWFFLYVKKGGGPFTRVPLGAQPEGVPSALENKIQLGAEVLGYLDLDGDGAMELWLEQPWFEATSWMLVRLRDGAWQIIDQFVEGT
jgi:hypothetical protein